MSKVFLFFLLGNFLLKFITANEWNYDNYGGDGWETEFESCGGREQSPIDIETANLTYDASLRALNFNNYDTLYTWILTDKNSTLKYDGINNNSLQDASVSGSNLNQDYYLLQFHFHFGFNDSIGSEHFIDGKQFPMELHLVHRSKTGNLTVLGFLFTISEFDNPNLEPMLDPIRKLNSSEDSQIGTFTLASFLPPKEKLAYYYRYLGSLTTPPCSEGILWNLFETKINISRNQMLTFRRSEIKNNFRIPQEIFTRQVFTSRPKQTDNKNPLSILIDLIKWLLQAIWAYFRN